MAKLLPFLTRRHRHDAAAYVLALSARYERMSKRQRPLDQPESLGNKLQRLTLKRPAIVIVIENLVDMLEELEP
jgi:hypothetical protein